MSAMHMSGGAAVTDRVEAIVAEMKAMEGPLLPIFHRIQAEFGHVPQESLPVIASGLNLSRAEVHGVMTFYHDFKAHPHGEHVVKICRAEACQSMGGHDLEKAAKALLGIDFHQTTLDGKITLEPVYCLGLCSCAPAVMVDGEIAGRVTASDLKELIAEVKA